MEKKTMLRLRPYNKNDADIILSCKRIEYPFTSGRQVLWVSIP